MTRRTRLTLKRVRQIGWRHNAQEDHGTTLGPGARESYPSKRSAAGNPRLRFLATWAGLGEPTAAADTHPAHLDHRRHRGKPDRHRRRRPVGDGRHSRTEHLRRRTGVGHIHSDAGLPHYRHRRRQLLDYPADGRGAALGDRGAQTHPHRRAQHLPSPMASRGRRPYPVGSRDGTVHDPLRPVQQAVHPAVSVRGRHLRRSGRHRCLSDNRVRIAPRGRSGARGGTTAAAVDVGPSWAEP